MSTLEPTSFLFEIAEHRPIPLNKLAYFQARLRYNLYDYIISKFKKMEKEEGLTRAELARRIGCKPEQITRRLGAPGNWTLDTISDLLIGIAGEELEPKSISVLGRAKRNTNEKSWREFTEIRLHSRTPGADKPKSVVQFNDSSARLSASNRPNIASQQSLTASKSQQEISHSAMGDTN